MEVKGTHKNIVGDFSIEIYIYTRGVGGNQAVGLERDPPHCLQVLVLFVSTHDQASGSNPWLQWQ